MEIEKTCCENFKTKCPVQVDNEYPALIKNCVESIAKKEGFLTHNVKTKKISMDGGNYLGVLFEIDIKGKTKNGDKEVNLFVKNIVPMNATLGEMFSISEAYLKECFVYRDLSKIFTKLQDEAGVPKDERYKMPKGYDESSSEAIITENMAKKGFKVCSRMKSVPLKFVELSVEQLAKFHALGFVIKKKMPEFNRKLSEMEYPLKFNKEWYKFFDNMAKTSTENIKQEYKKKVESFVQTAADKMRRYIIAENEILTICHGDYRANNILMKEEEGEVTEVVPVDYQIVYNGSPVMDLLYFIYGCTDRQFRKTHMANLIELYYDTLRDFLKYFDIDVTDVYPRQKFDTALKEKQDYALIVALAYFPFFYAPEDDFLDVTEDIYSQKVALTPIAKERIEEIIEDLDAVGLIKS